MGDKFQRIGVNKKVGPVRVRASRSGGVNAAISPVKRVTLNSRHGVRVSTTYKGLLVGLQNFNSVVRGRWTTKNKKININLSKPGISSSINTSVGAFNFTNPSRSSATVGGIQVRGKNAAWINGFSLVISLVIGLVKITFVVAKHLILIATWLMVNIWNLFKLLVFSIVFFIMDLPKQLIKKKVKPSV